MSRLISRLRSCAWSAVLRQYRSLRRQLYELRGTSLAGPHPHHLDNNIATSLWLLPCRTEVDVADERGTSLFRKHSSSRPRTSILCGCHTRIHVVRQEDRFTCTCRRHDSTFVLASETPAAVPGVMHEEKKLPPRYRRSTLAGARDPAAVLALRTWRVAVSRVVSDPLMLVFVSRVSREPPSPAFLPRPSPF